MEFGEKLWSLRKARNVGTEANLRMGEEGGGVSVFNPPYPPDFSRDAGGGSNPPSHCDRLLFTATHAVVISALDDLRTSFFSTPPPTGRLLVLTTHTPLLSGGRFESSLPSLPKYLRSWILPYPKLSKLSGGRIEYNCEPPKASGETPFVSLDWRGAITVCERYFFAPLPRPT